VSHTVFAFRALVAFQVKGYNIVPSAYCLLGAGLLFGILFNPEDGGEMFFRSVCSFSADHTVLYHKQRNSVALVRERTIPTERPSLVDELSANFCE
jgi:hypothetical protein